MSGHRFVHVPGLLALRPQEGQCDWTAWFLGGRRENGDGAGGSWNQVRSGRTTFAGGAEELAFCPLRNVCGAVVGLDMGHGQIWILESVFFQCNRGWEVRR